MAIAAVIIFFLSLIGIVGLFVLKNWELSHERVLFARFRTNADHWALHLKDLLLAGRKDIEHLPPILLFAAESVVHGIAVDAGHVAIWLGNQAHRLADSVSHKRNFTRGETRSEFLKKVSEHKNGNGNGDSETTSL